MTEPTAPTPTVSTNPRILVLASYQYLDYGHVLTHLVPLAPATFHVASQIGVGHALLIRKGNHSLDVAPLKWQPTRPHLEVHADAAILFWDGSDKALLPSAVILKRAGVPMTIIGPDGNTVDLAHFCATLTNGDKMTTTPAVIVDAPAQPHEKTARVLVKLSIPEDVYSQYDAQSKLVKQPVEKVLSDRLRTCVSHTSGRGLYFNDEQRAHLERITGGHIIQNADVAISKIQVVVQLKVADVTIELTERVLARATARAKSYRKTLAEYVTKEVIEGLERATGLRPW